MRYFDYIVPPKEGAEPAEPVTLADVKAWLQVDFTDHDTLLTAMAKGARQSVEAFTNRTMIVKDVQVGITPTYPDTFYELPYTDKVSAVVVRRINQDGTETVLTENTHFFVHQNRVKLPEGSFDIRYQTEAFVNEALKEAIKMEVAERYRNRGENDKQYAQQQTGLSEAARQKAQPFQITWL